MDTRFLTLLGLLIVVVGIGSGLALAGAHVPGIGTYLASEQPAAITNFESAGAQCTEDFIANSSTVVKAGHTNTQISHARNVSLPDPSYALGNPSLTRLNETAYVLNIPIEETEKPPRGCPGVARYNGTVRLPAGEDQWQLVVEHDGEYVTMLYGASSSSLLGGSSRVGQRVSAPADDGNQTSG